MYRFPKSRLFKQPKLSIDPQVIPDQSASQPSEHLDETFEALSDLSIPDDVNAFHFTDMSISGLESPFRARVGIPPATGGEVTPVSKASMMVRWGDTRTRMIARTSQYCIALISSPSKFKTDSFFVFLCRNNDDEEAHVSVSTCNITPESWFLFGLVSPRWWSWIRL